MSSLREQEKRRIEEGLRRLREERLDLADAEDLQTFVESKKQESLDGGIALALGLILLGAGLIIYLTEKRGH
ncbi:MAG: hypothetical protein DLM72_11260 [Candidatus Nitrosopolaris wilkensis]|nr:MAG: hypothetical protein DLM72_11260 [Candidatus Nitrosopolaris wilkensis]